MVKGGQCDHHHSTGLIVLAMAPGCPNASCAILSGAHPAWSVPHITKVRDHWDITPLGVTKITLDANRDHENTDITQSVPGYPCRGLPLEDEVHVVLKCPTHSDLRALYGPLFAHLPLDSALAMRLLFCPAHFWPQACFLCACHSWRLELVAGCCPPLPPELDLHLEFDLPAAVPLPRCWLACLLALPWSACWSCVTWPFLPWFVPFGFSFGR